MALMALVGGIDGLEAGNLIGWNGAHHSGHVDRLDSNNNIAYLTLPTKNQVIPKKVGRRNHDNHAPHLTYRRHKVVHTSDRYGEIQCIFSLTPKKIPLLLSLLSCSQLEQ